jgi:type IV pilus assembly protein PilP
MMKTVRPLAAIGLCGFTLLIAGCDVTDQGEVERWMSETRRDMKPMVQDIPEPKKFEPFLYQQQKAVDPFSPVKIEAALQKLAAKSSSGLHPDMDRRREPLEAFPLDTIRMVGVLRRPDAVAALLQVDRIVYQARVGNYVGQNFGVITKITEGDVTLKETVQDPSGQWVERITTLQLQESKK